MRTCSKTQKYWIAHNFFNFDRNIGMLHLILIVLMRGIQLKKNFSNLSYPVLTTSHNNSKWWQITHFCFQFFSYPFYMAIVSMERHIQMSWMYLKRSNRKLKWEHAVKLRNIGLLITSLILIITIGMLHLILIILMRSNLTAEEFFKFELPSSHNYSKWWQITHFCFQFFSYPFYMAIVSMERHIQMSWMYLKRSNRKLKWEHAVKLRNIGLLITSLILIITIGMLHLISIKLITGIQLKKNFSNLSYPILTTHNDDKLHIFVSNSLVILSI